MSLKNIFQQASSNKPLLQFLLFLNCFAFLFLLPFIPNLPHWTPKLFSTLIIVFSLMALEKDIKYIYFTGGIVILLNWLTNLTDNFYMSTFSESIKYMFLIWMVTSLISQIMRLKEVTVYNLLEAVNGYLLLGILFTSFVFFLDQHFPNSFSGANHPLKKGDLVYFTLITMTTTGYGDIVPITALAKELALIIAMSGQFYVAIIVAILVGKYSNRRKS